MVHFIVAIQQAIDTQKKHNKQNAGRRKHSPQQSSQPAPSDSAVPAEKRSESTARKEPFWKRWFSSSR